jgi:hypothetical protein
MGIGTRDNGQMTEKTDLEYITTTVLTKNMKVNGKMVINTEKELSATLLEINTQGNGSKEKNQDSELWSFMMVPSTKENG